MFLSQDTLRDLMGEVFCRMYPDDKFLFGEVWDQLERDLGGAGPESSGVIRPPRLGVVGEGGGDERKIDEIVALFRGLLDLVEVNPVVVLGRVCEIYARRGESQERIDLIKETLKRILIDLEGERKDWCYCKRLRGGEVKGPNPRALSFAKGVINRRELFEYGFIVDELASLVRFWKQEPIPMERLTPVQAGVMWFAMSRVGEAAREHVTIEDLFEVIGERGKLDFSYYGDQLGRRLDGIYKKIFIRIAEGRYRVSRDGWSFWWLCDDPNASVLLQRSRG